MNEFIIHSRPRLNPFEMSWGTFGIPLWQLIENIRENNGGMLDRLEQLSIPANAQERSTHGTETSI